MSGSNVGKIRMYCDRCNWRSEVWRGLPWPLRCPACQRAIFGWRDLKACSFVLLTRLVTMMLPGEPSVLVQFDSATGEFQRSSDHIEAPRVSACAAGEEDE